MQVLIKCKNSATTQTRTIKKTCTRQTNNKLNHELKENAIKNKAEEAIKRKKKKKKSSNSLLGVSSKICKKNTYTICKNSNANEMNQKKQNHEKEEEDCICKLLWVVPCLHRKRPYTQALLLCLIARPHCKPNSYYHQGVRGGFGQLGLLALS
jgi:hypothetical protein